MLFTWSVMSATAGISVVEVIAYVVYGEQFSIHIDILHLECNACKGCDACNPIACVEGH